MSASGMSVRPASTAEERTVMRVLVERGHYEMEQPDAFEWANADATNVVECVQTKGYTMRVVWDALVDTGLHDLSQGNAEMRCLRDDVEAIGEALRPFVRPS